jgi:hypothetical protein
VGAVASQQVVQQMPLKQVAVAAERPADHPAAEGTVVRARSVKNLVEFASQPTA